MKSSLIRLVCTVMTSVALFSTTNAQQMLNLVSPANGVLGLQTEVGSSINGSILVTNIGPLTGSVTVTGENRTEFFVNDTTGYFLGIADTAAISIRFQPNQVGTVYDTIRIESTLGTIWVVLAGTGTAGAEGSFIMIPSELNLGTVLVGAQHELAFSITNTSASTETFNLNLMSGASFSLVSPATFNVSSGQTATAVIRFSPSAEGMQYDSLEVTNGIFSRNAFVIGNGIVESDTTRSFIVSATNMNFGNVVVGMDTTKSFSVTNLVASAQQLDMRLAFGTEFTFGHANLLDLAGMATATFNIDFHPTAVGTHVDTLFVSNATTTIRVILSGNGTAAPAPSFHLTPTSLYLGPGQPGDSFTGVVTIVNEMPSPLIIVNAVISGADAVDFNMDNPIAYPLTIAANSQLAINISSTLRDDLHIGSANLIVASLTDTAICKLYQSYDSIITPPDTVKVRVENVSGLIGGTADVIVTLLSDLPPTAVRGEITYEFNASVMTPIRLPLASIIEGGDRRVSFDFTPMGDVSGEILTKEQFILTLGDAESTPVAIVSLKLFDANNKPVRSETYSNGALVSVEDASGRTVNANSVGLTLQLAPNPATNSVTASFTSTTAPSHLTIYNNMGMLVADVSGVLPQTLDGSVQIALDALGTGTYMIRLSTESSTIVRTLVKY